MATTKLIKASTALKRAESVNIADLVISNAANQIANAAAYGRTETHIWVANEYLDEVTSKLLDAGYVLEYGQMFEEIVDFIEDTRSAIRRFFDRLLGRTPVTGPVFESRPNHNDIMISWAPLPEAVDEDEAFAEAA